MPKCSSSLDPSLALSDSPSLTLPPSHFSPLCFPFRDGSGQMGGWHALVLGGRGISYLLTLQPRISQQLASGDVFIISALCILIFPQRFSACWPRLVHFSPSDVKDLLKAHEQRSPQRSPLANCLMQRNLFLHQLAKASG